MYMYINMYISVHTVHVEINSFIKAYQYNYMYMYVHVRVARIFCYSLSYVVN